MGSACHLHPAALDQIEDLRTERAQQLLLETGLGQPEAIALYHKLGFTPIANYGPYVTLGSSLCMAKSLTDLVTE